MFPALMTLDAGAVEGLGLEILVVHVKQRAVELQAAIAPLVFQPSS